MLPLIPVPLSHDKLCCDFDQLVLGKDADAAAASGRVFDPARDVQPVGARIDDPGEWAVMPLLTDELPFVGEADRASERWRVVLKLHRGDYEPWLLVGPSAFLAAKGIDQDGLYAMRAFRGRGPRGLTDSEDTIGTYSGEILAGPFQSTDSPAALREGTAAAQRGKDALLWVRRAGGWFLIDGAEGGPPYLSKMNDGGARSNVRLLPSGRAVASKRVPAADLQSARALQSLAPSELLVPYGAAFWRLHRNLGSEGVPLVVESAAASP